MTENQPDSEYTRAIKDKRSLATFLAAMKKFSMLFCANMFCGADFTLVLEVRGNCKELLHCRVKDMTIDRPPGVEKRIEEKSDN